MLLLIIAAILLVIGYVVLIKSIWIGEAREVNAYSFMIWGSLSLCLNLLSKEPSVDVVIQYFAITMSIFQFMVAFVSFKKKQVVRIQSYELLAIIVALAAMILWYFFQKQVGFFPLGLIIVADTCALLPSLIDIRKSEKIEVGVIHGFLLFGITATLVLFGIETKNPQSLAYPVFETCVNFGVTIFATCKYSKLQRKEICLLQEG